MRDDSAPALARYWDRGFHLEENLIPEEMIRRVMDVAMEQPNAKNGLFAPIPMPHNVDPVFLEMMRLGPIVDIVERLLGGTASGLGGEFFYMKPGTPGFTKHQDNVYVQAPPDGFLSVWTALTDVDADNGALTFYPGSHKLGALETRKLHEDTDPGQNPKARAIECILPADFEGVTIAMRRGSSVFFHSQLVHSSNGNRSSRFRYSFLATYLRKGASFTPGRAQQRTEIELHSLSSNE
jgi:non-haem Fe2+, alpha-ketoglutarate-dependent halogenase